MQLFKADLKFWQPPRAVTGPLQLNRHNIFILPSRHGLLAAFSLFVMLLGALNYNSNLAYALVFWLGSVMLLSILHAFRNLSRIQVSCQPGQPVFAGDTARFTVQLDNPGKHPRLALGLQQGGRLQDHGDIPPHGHSRLQLSVATERRGKISAPWFQLFSQHPFGLFHAWSRLNIQCETLVYPRPAARRLPLQDAASRQGRQQHPTHRQEDDFYGLRSYAPGDAPTRIAWKALAGDRGLYAKTYASEAGDELWLDWNQFAPLDSEARLEQLTAWVLHLDTSGQPYGLRLPGTSIAPARGEAHRHHCLEVLALCVC